MIYSYEHIWFLLKAKTFLIHDHIMISDLWTKIYNITSIAGNPPSTINYIVTMPTIQMMAALGLCWASRWWQLWDCAEHPDDGSLVTVLSIQMMATLWICWASRWWQLWECAEHPDDGRLVTVLSIQMMAALGQDKKLQTIEMVEEYTAPPHYRGYWKIRQPDMMCQL